MRYELIRLAQLVFALSLMFGAFIGGMAVGWWRWGRRAAGSTRGPLRSVPEAPKASAGLFTPNERDDDEIVLSHPIFDTGPHDTPAQLGVPVFAASPEIEAHNEAPSSS